MNKSLGNIATVIEAPEAELGFGMYIVIYLCDKGPEYSVVDMKP